MTVPRQAIERVFREESGRFLAGLIRVLGDFDLAEDALQDACAAALEGWAAGGVPEKPGAWITTVAQHKAIDLIRRRKIRGEDAGSRLEGGYAVDGETASERPTRWEDEVIDLLESRTDSTMKTTWRYG